MKKFMKAIAFATVMCLVLSTVAFAAATVDYATKTVSITVEGAPAGEQVAIVITKAGEEIAQGSILYVDQKAGNEFTAVITDETVEAVDIYAGFASNTTGKKVAVATGLALSEEEVTTISITLADVEIVELTEVLKDGYVENRVDEGTKAAVVKVVLNVADASEEDAVAGMFWKFIAKADGAENTTDKYFRADQAIVDAINSKVMTGGIELAAALDSTGWTITDAEVILSVNGEDVFLTR